jgi:hypothetical protein
MPHAAASHSLGRWRLVDVHDLVAELPYAGFDLAVDRSSINFGPSRFSARSPEPA